MPPAPWAVRHRPFSSRLPEEYDAADGDRRSELWAGRDERPRWAKEMDLNLRGARAALVHAYFRGSHLHPGQQMQRKGERLVAGGRSHDISLNQ
jgi:hypothetical protein